MEERVMHDSYFIIVHLRIQPSSKKKPKQEKENEQGNGSIRREGYDWRIFGGEIVWTI